MDPSPAGQPLLDHPEVLVDLAENEHLQKSAEGFELER